MAEGKFGLPIFLRLLNIQICILDCKIIISISMFTIQYRNTSTRMIDNVNICNFIQEIVEICVMHFNAQNEKNCVLNFNKEFLCNLEPMYLLQLLSCNYLLWCYIHSMNLNGMLEIIPQSML